MTDKKVIQLAQEMINFFTEICHLYTKLLFFNNLDCLKERERK